MAQRPNIQINLLANHSSEATVLSLLSPQRSLESEASLYSFTTKLGDIGQSRAVLLVYSVTQTLTTRDKELLLFLGSFSVEVFLLLTSCAKRKGATIDKTEHALREQLSAQGLAGDEASIIRCQGEPLPESMELLLAALDQNPRLLSPPPQRRKPPSQPPFTRLLHRLYSIQRLAAEFSFTPTPPNELYASPISTQIGGIPYIEAGEAWPRCQRCPSNPPKIFLWQLDVRQVLGGGLGLFVFYFCDDPQHPEPYEEIFEIRHYPEPTMKQRREAPEALRLTPSEASLISARASALYHKELPHPNQLRDKKAHPNVWRLVEESSHKKKGAQEQTFKEAADLLGARIAAFSAESFRVGGYCEMPRHHKEFICERCKKRMSALASISPSARWSFSRYFSELRCFVCPCSPERVRVYLSGDIDQEDFDPYDWDPVGA